MEQRREERGRDLANKLRLDRQESTRGVETSCLDYRLLMAICFPRVTPNDVEVRYCAVNDATHIAVLDYFDERMLNEADLEHERQVVLYPKAMQLM